jgi:uncharacterized membrane protein YkoI
MVALALALGGLATAAAISPVPAAAQTQRAIGGKKATAIALKDAGFKKSQVKKLKVELGRERGHKVYEVEFRKGKYAYEYDIDRYTGRIVEKDVERIRGKKATAKKTTAKKAIGKDKATAIALKDAGFKKSQVSRLKVEVDREDGRKVYEVEFRAGGYEYEYDIDCYTGRIVDKDVERIKR